MAVDSTVAIRLVIKRDGHISAYDFGKIARSIYRALDASGTPDAILSREVAELVEFYLLQDHGGGRVRSSRIASVTEEVLRQTQLDAAAYYFRNFQDRRNFIRTQIEIRKSIVQTELFQDPDVIGESVEQWSKKDLYRSLLQRGMTATRSEMISNEIERQIIQSGMRSMSEPLLQAWVENTIDLQKQDIGMFRSHK